ncbi:MAG: Major facilitator transporter [Herbaspirillum sp.]|nr:Major facilitator transporter [Herbaspirillum sp.]
MDEQAATLLATGQCIPVWLDSQHPASDSALLRYLAGTRRAIRLMPSMPRLDARSALHVRRVAVSAPRCLCFSLRIVNPMNSISKKYVITSVLFAGWFVSYLDRFLINMALPFIGKEFHMDEVGLGMMLSVFFMGYAIIQLPGGWLSDKIGSRKMMIFSLVMFTIFTALTGLAWSIVSLFVIRFFFGIFEGSFPTASFKAVSEHFPKSDRARVQSVLLATNPLSLAVAPIVAAPLIIWMGWRGMFIAMSVFGVIASILYMLKIKPLSASSENVSSEADKKSLKELLHDSNIWKISIINFGVNILIWGFLSWLPSYMLKVQKLDLLHAGILSSLPGFAGIAGMLIGGWLLDKWFENREKYLLIASVSIAAVCLFVMTSTTVLPIVVTCQIVMAFSVKLAFIALWSLPLKMIDSSNMGSASGIVNLGSQLAGVVSPAVMGYLIVAYSGSYNGAFGFLIGCAVVCVAVSMTLRGNKGITANRIQPVEAIEPR